MMFPISIDNALNELTERASVWENYLEDFPVKALRFGIRLLLTLLAFFIGVQIIKLIRRIVRKSLTKAKADVGVVQFLDSVIKVILYVLLIFTLVGSFGVDTTGVLAIVGSAGVALGLALQGSLSNFAGGVLILLFKPFRVGDYIKEDNMGNEGTVTEIYMFFTKLRTPDNRVIVLPNGPLANTSLTNVTALPKRRMDIPVGVSYDTDLKKAREVLSDVLEKEEKILKDEEHFVLVDELGDFAVKLKLRFWVKKEDYWDVKWSVTENAKNALDHAGIEIPFPQVVVHKKKKG